MKAFFRSTAVLGVVAALAAPVGAQTAGGASLTPYVGYLIPGDWYSGPIGTSISVTNAPLFGVQGSVPLAQGVALVGNLSYAKGDLRIGLPLVGGVNVGSAAIWMYDAGVEVGGLKGKTEGIAPFVQGGLGAMTTDIKNGLLGVNATSFAFTAALGADIGVSEGFAVRVQVKDWISRFNSEDAIGFKVDGNLAHNIALSAGVRLNF